MCMGFFDDSNDHTLVCELDFDSLDSTEERLAEAAGISITAASRALQWMKEQGEVDHDHDVSDTILRVLQLIRPSGTPNFFTTGIRAEALRWLIRADGVSLTQLAAEGGISKQLLSHHVRDLEDSTGIHSAAQKSPHAIESYRQAALESWERTADRVARRNGKRSASQVEDAYAQAGLPQLLTPVENLTTREV